MYTNCIRLITLLSMMVLLLVGATLADVDSAKVSEPDSVKIKTIVPDVKLYDFEGDTVALHHGWIVVTDTILGGNSTGEVTIVSGGVDSTGQSIKVTGTVASKNPFVMFSGITTRFGYPVPIYYDVTSYTGLRFWAKGDGNTYRVELACAAVTDYMYHSFAFTPPAGEWKEYFVPFKGFKQQPYGKPVVWTGKDVIGIQFFTVGGPLESFNLQVDEIELYKK